MKDKNKIEQLKNSGWEEMESLLDEHLPRERRRPAPFVWWAAAAGLLVLIAFATTLDFNRDSVPPSYSAKSDKQPSVPNKQLASPSNTRNSREKKDESPADNKAISINSSNRDKDQSSPAFRSSKNRITDNNLNRSTTDIQDIAVFHQASGSEKTTENGTTGNVQKSSSSNPILPFVEKGENLSPSVSFIPTKDPIVKSGKFPERTSLESPVRIHNETNTIALHAIAFAESVWSFSDQFGFVSVGPGINLERKRWTGRVSAGISFPLPSEKSFSYANSGFSEKYNFDSPENLNSAASPGNAGSVYYQQYRTKPGLMVQGSLQYDLFPKLGASVHAGNYWFKYKYEQYTNSNQIVTERIIHPDLKNSILFAGFQINYSVTRSVLLELGGRFLNIDHIGDASFVPNLGLVYEW